MRKIRVKRAKKKNFSYVKRRKWKVTTVDIVREGILLPPAAHLCQACAVEHSPELPHNYQSMFFQYWFYRQHGHFPSWLDAMAHCAPEMQERWKEELSKREQNLEHRGVQ